VAARRARTVAGADASGSSSNILTEFRRGLGETGFVEGNNVTIDYRWAEDRFDRLPALAGDLVRHNVSLIAVGGGDVAGNRDNTDRVRDWCRSARRSGALN
jgi:putative ABC transport system substrate-binding protein